MAGEKILGDPAAFAGTSEHSQQVALFAALVQYEGWARANAKAMDQAVEKLWSSGDDSDWRYSEEFKLKGLKKEWLGLADRLHWIHAIPNGGTRGSDKRSAMIAGANMKAEGVKTGVSDLDIVAARHGYHGFKLEMKAPGKLKGESKEQKEYGAFLKGEGYLYAVFDSWVDALKAIKWYLGIEAHPFEWALG